jgi:hypothetical protein
MLSRAIANRRMRNMNSFWRGYLADGRFIGLTKVIFVTANRPDGRVLLSNTGSPDLNLAFLEEPSEIPTSDIGKFAWAMCCAAVEQAYGRRDRRGVTRGGGNWLKAAKRAYNYFSTIGDTAHMTALEPVFRTPEAQLEQYASVVDGIDIVLSPEDLGVRQPNTRIITVTEARRQIALVADVVRRELPTGGPAIAADLMTHASAFTARNARGQLAQDAALAGLFEEDAKAIRRLLNLNLQSRVQPIIDSAVRPYCSDAAACRR